jgi:hypothetical protein
MPTSIHGSDQLIFYSENAFYYSIILLMNRLMRIIESTRNAMAIQSILTCCVLNFALHGPELVTWPQRNESRAVITRHELQLTIFCSFPYSQVSWKCSIPIRWFLCLWRKLGRSLRSFCIRTNARQKTNRDQSFIYSSFSSGRGTTDPFYTAELWNRSESRHKFVTFQVVTAAIMKMTAFWDTAPCSLAELDRRFGGAPTTQICSLLL